MECYLTEAIMCETRNYFNMDIVLCAMYTIMCKDCQTQLFVEEIILS